MEQSPKKLHIFRWVLSIYALILAALFVVSVAFPSLSFLRLTLLGSNLPLMLLSFWAWLFVIWIILETKIIVGVTFTRKNRIAIFAALAALFAYYSYSLITRQFIYY